MRTQYDSLANNDASRDFENAWATNYNLFISRARKLSVNSNQDPEDLLSQATIRVLKYIFLEKNIENLVGLIFISMLHEKLDQRKLLSERVFRESMPLEQEGVAYDSIRISVDTEREVIAQDTLRQLLEFVETLPLVYRRIFNMRFMDGESHSEISKAIGISEQNVRQKLRLMRMKIQLWEKNR